MVCFLAPVRSKLTREDRDAFVTLLRARISSALPTVVLLLTPCFARERGPRVEVLCPLPPSPVTIGKDEVVVYELHVTNFDTVPVTLKRVEIFANQKGSEPLVTFEDDKLLAAMMRVGSAMVMSSGSNGRTQDTRMIDPGGRNVVFMWIELGGEADGSGVTEASNDFFVNANRRGHAQGRNPRRLPGAGKAGSSPNPEPAF